MKYEESIRILRKWSSKKDNILFKNHLSQAELECRVLNAVEYHAAQIAIIIIVNDNCQRWKLVYKSSPSHQIERTLLQTGSTEARIFYSSDQLRLLHRERVV